VGTSTTHHKYHLVKSEIYDENPTWRTKKNKDKRIRGGECIYIPSILPSLFRTEEEGEKGWTRKENIKEV